MTSLVLQCRRGTDKATNGLSGKRGHSDETGLNNEAELQNVNNQIGKRTKRFLWKRKYFGYGTENMRKKIVVLDQACRSF